MQACKSAVKSGESVQMSYHQGPGLCEYWRKGEHEGDNGNASSIVVLIDKKANAGMLDWMPASA